MPQTSEMTVSTGPDAVEEMTVSTGPDAVEEMTVEEMTVSTGSLQSLGTPRLVVPTSHSEESNVMKRVMKRAVEVSGGSRW